MSYSPLISVLMPAYQAAATIDEAIGSVVDQEHSAWELVVVDDGSTDETARKLAEWQRRDDRVRVLHHPGRRNLGRPASRNLTVQVARGSLVAFLDADDMLLPDALSTYARTFASCPNLGVVYAEAEVLGEAPIPQPRARGLPGVPVSLFRQLCRFNVLVTSATAVRKTALGSAPFPAELPLGQDWACWVDLARRQRFLFVAKTVARYRMNPRGGQAGLVHAGLQREYFASEIGWLTRLLDVANENEQRHIRDGLVFRSTHALMMAASSFRRRRLRIAVSWLRAARAAVGGPVSLLRAVADVVPRQRAVWSRSDLPLSVDPWETP